MRSCPFEELLPLFETEGIHWVCLQKEIPLSDRGPAEICKHLERVSLDDFTAKANQSSGLDLVISVDTSVAHLAGALNVPVGSCWPGQATGDGCWIATTVRGTQARGCSDNDRRATERQSLIALERN